MKTRRTLAALAAAALLALAAPAPVSAYPGPYFAQAAQNDITSTTGIGITDSYEFGGVCRPAWQTPAQGCFILQPGQKVYDGSMPYHLYGWYDGSGAKTDVWSWEYASHTGQWYAVYQGCYGPGWHELIWAQTTLRATAGTC